MGGISEDVLFYKDSLASSLEALEHNANIQKVLEICNSFVAFIFNDPSAKEICCVILLLVFGVVVYRFVGPYRAWQSKVQVTWDDNRLPRLGEVATLKIFMLLSGNALQFYPPPNPETIGDEFLSQVSVRIFHEDGHETISQKSVDVFERLVLVRFNLERSGKYTIHVMYQGYPVGSTPIQISVDSETMDPTKSIVSVTSPIVATEGRNYRVDIIPVDEYGNRCSATNDDLERLSVEMEKLGEGADTRIDENELLSSFGLRKDTSIQDDPVTVITLNLKPQQAGVSLMNLLHNHEPFPVPSASSKYEIVVLSEDEELMVMLNQMENKQALSPITFPAMWTQSSDAPSSPTDDNGIMSPLNRSRRASEIWLHRMVQVELSPRFVYFRGKLTPESILTTIIMTFRVSPQTQIDIIDQFTSSQGELEYALDILDKLSNYSVQIWMKAGFARTFYALFTKFTRSYEDGSQPTFDSKREAFFRKLREQQNPISKRMSTNYRFLKIRRNDEIESTLDETRNFTASDWRKSFIILYHGEPTRSSRDAWISWADSVLGKLLENNSFGMFYSLGSSKLIHPNPNRNPRWTYDHYELVGKLVGKLLYESAIQDDKAHRRDCTVKARFTRSFLAQILSFMPNYKHLELDMPDMYTGTIEPILKEDVTSKGLYFMGPSYDDLGNLNGLRSVTPDCPGNQVPVTNDNKLTYLDDLSKLLMHSKVIEEVSAFVAGLSLLIPQELLMSFSENELELLICGCSKWSIQDFKKYSKFADGTMIPHAPRLKEWLWETLREMDFQDKGLFLQFLTGSSRLPPQGLSELNPRIKINVSCLFGQIPCANPVAHTINLSDHANRQEFAAALITAVKAQLT